jgi:tetratricopeptide (TPR) repeat protein
MGLEKKIKEPLKDSLREESLERQNKDRLSPFLGENSSKRNLSFCHLNLINKGLKGLRRSFNQRKGEASYWNDMGVCFYLKGDYSKAYYYFNVSLEKTKNEKIKSLPYNNLGLLYLLWKKYSKAIESFEKASLLNPEAKVPRYNMAQTFLTLGYSKKALNILGKISGTFEDDDFYISKGYAYLIQKKFQKALLELNKVSSAKEKRHDVGLYKAYSYLHLGQLDTALKFLEERQLSQNKRLIYFENKVKKEIIKLKKEKESEQY